jgi:glycogen debranching enzyme
MTATQSQSLHVPATAASQERHPVVLKHGDAFAVFDDRGDIAGALGTAEGLYAGGTRIVSRFELRFAGHRPLLLSANTQEDNAVFDADLTNADMLTDDDTVFLSRELMQIQRMRFVWQGALYERILVRNFDEKPCRLSLTLEFGADFIDVFEVRGQHRAHHGTTAVAIDSPAHVTYDYDALDGVRTRSSFQFDPPPRLLEEKLATFDLELDHDEGTRIFVRFGLDSANGPAFGPREFYRDMRAARRDRRIASAGATSASSTNPIFNEIVRRSVSDTYMLVTKTKDGPYPFAGVPWYSTPFGRDGLITAMMMLWADPSMARGVLKFLAQTQATEHDDTRDAEPGKILHEMRDGEMARMREVPFGRYYGSVDATPLFVLLLGMYYERTGDLDLVRELWPNVTAALAWIATYGDADGDGFVEYKRKSENGLANQGWKDSQDAIFHADGSMAKGAIALCEVQAYVFGAKQLAGKMAAALGMEAEALRLEREAEMLRARFEAAFWCEELSTYAIAIDGAKEPCRVRTSNAGHTLLTGMISHERACRVAQTLLSPSSYSGWGIRTVALTSSRYNPLSYHNGSVWPHDNGVIAMGLARYGLKEPVLRIMTGLIDAASALDLRRLPELFCGFERRRRPSPTLYPVACAPQAWSSATVFALLQAALGLTIDSFSNKVRFDHPMLPGMLDDIRLSNVYVGDARLDVRLRRSGAAVAVTVERRTGEVEVDVLC